MSLWCWRVRTRSALWFWCMLMGLFWMKIVSFFFLEPSSLDCPCCMLSCHKERSSCPLVFHWSPASGTLRPGRLIFKVPIFFEVLIFCLVSVFRTDSIFQVAGQLTQCSLVEPLLLPSNLLTLFCRYLDKRTVHQLKSNMEWVFTCIPILLFCPVPRYNCSKYLDLDLRLDSWHFHPKEGAS